MKKTLALLTVLLLGFPLLAPIAPRRSTSLGAALGQTVPDKPTTVEGRRSALKQVEESAQLSLSNGDTLEAARSLTRAGALHLLLNDPQAAIATHLRALELLRQSPNSQLEVDNLTGRANAYLNTPPSKAPNAPDNLALAQS
ncbi:MAG TPA: tetratricopeptide repeat protein, partial [Pyrinomonadaceae bacterium]|nr:tetratricopeptide repeat protein [Pyrinomonadaceae bacterium]